MFGFGRQADSRVITYHRTFARHGGDRNGKPIAKELAKPKALDFWATTKKSHLREELVLDAARVLRCDVEDVILMDQGRTVDCWENNGKHPDVVTYERY